MYFTEAFNLLRQGKILSVEDTEYRLSSVFPPRMESRQKGSIDSPWEERIKDYILFTMATNLWEVS